MILRQGWGLGQFTHHAPSILPHLTQTYRAKSIRFEGGLDLLDVHDCSDVFPFFIDRLLHL